MIGLILRIFVVLVIIGGILWWYSTPEQEVSGISGEIGTVDALLLYEEENEVSAELSTSSDKKEIILEDGVDEGALEDLAFPLVQKDDLPQKESINVPFVVQAPKAQWEDKWFQDACEEASMLMIHYWASGDKWSTSGTKTEDLEKIFAAEEQFFGGTSIDTSAADTAKFIEHYYNYETKVIESVSLHDIYGAIAAGYLVIAPTNGKALQNPYFSNGGPERHMLVITGYDLKKGEFITNDPGTKRGADYRYKVSTLYNAIRDYDSGIKEPIDGIKRNVILVKKP